MQQLTIQVNTKGNPAVTLSWIFRGFFGNICESYLKGAPRRQEAYGLCKDMTLSALENGSITREEHENLVAELDILVNNVVPRGTKI